MLVEDGRPGLDGLELVPDGVEVLPLQDAGLQGGLVGVVREDVPGAEDEVVEAGEARRSP